MPHGLVDDVADAIRSAEPHVTTGAELARELDEPKQDVLQALRTLEHVGDVASKETGANAIAWWATERVSPPTDHSDDELALGDQEDEPSDDVDGPSEPVPPIDVDADETIDEVIQNWRPGRSADERGKRRREGREALMWLRSTGDPATATDFAEALYDDDSEPSEDTWWRTWIRPALKQAVEANLVEYSHGRHEYEWTD